MCGIGGYVGAPAAESCEGALLQALRHRGPDDEATARLDRGGAAVRLCFTRLAILDLSPLGRQPMATEDGALTLIYNGEAYNCAELRVELQARGHRFRSTSDTEVVLRGYREWGIEVLDRLRGMYAFALWDAPQQELVLARDRIGVKPLYYRFDPDAPRLSFASEVRALLKAGLCERRMDPEALHGFLALGSIPEPRTLLRGVALLPPGHLLRANVRGGRIEAPALLRYHHLPLPTSLDVGTDRTGSAALREVLTRPGRAGDAAARVAPLLQEAVALRLLADVPVGVLLSGGVDSTAVAVLARRADPGGALHSFTLTYGEDSKESEGEEARRLALSLGLIHHERLESEADLLRQAASYQAAVDQPSADGFNTFLVAAVVRAAGLKVALSGLGGDEAFLGYDLRKTFAGALALPTAAGLSAVAQALLPDQDAAIDPAQQSNLDAALALRTQKRLDLVRAATAAGNGAEAQEASDNRPQAVYAALRSFFPAAARRALLEPDLGISNLPASVHIHCDLSPAQRAALPAPELLSYLEIHNYLRSTLLRDADVMSMAHGVELRVPLCDHLLLSMVTSLPEDARRRSRPMRHRNKPLLLDACGSPLLDQAAARRKRGFVLPLATWLRGGALGEAASALLNDAATARSLGLRPMALSRLWALFRGADPGHAARLGDATFRVWALYTLLAWAREHRISL